MKIYNTCVLGGGASGLMAAANLNKKLEVCLIEKNEILGRKIMATGGGRCNITNIQAPHKDETLEFFKSIGMETYCDNEGRYYPYSNQAKDVVITLKETLIKRGTHIITGFNVKEITNKKGLFHITDGQKDIVAKNLILATGGKAAPNLGTIGDGYRFAKDFGHNITSTFPILTGLENGDFRDIKGVRTKGTVTLFKDDLPLRSETGEIQFNETGISGICVMNLTTDIKLDRETKFKRYSLGIDFAPDFTAEELKNRKSSFGIISKTLSSRVGISELKDWRIPILNVKGWKDAQCTSGGVDLVEIDMDTMESKKIEKLFLIGELIDIQGPCGGYNLQNAWHTGLKAAKTINEREI